MTDKAAIRELREKVEAGDWGIEASRLARQIRPDYNDLMWDTYCGSLDAALALHEAVLPDSKWQIEFNGLRAVVTIDWYDDVEADTPARALLIAILRAMEND